MNIAAQCLDGAGDDGQPQPRSGASSGATSERYEKGVCQARGQAAALVLHFDDEMVAQVSCTYADVSPVRCVLETVLYEIRHSRSEELPIGDDFEPIVGRETPA